MIQFEKKKLNKSLTLSVHCKLAGPTGGRQKQTQLLVKRTRSIWEEKINVTERHFYHKNCIAPVFLSCLFI